MFFEDEFDSVICLGKKFVRGKNVDVRKRCKGDESVKKQKVNEEEKLC